MPIHDWKKVDTGVFHTFHGSWIAKIHEALMSGLLPAGYFALTDTYLDGVMPDILTLRHRDTDGFQDDSLSGTMLKTHRPKAFHIVRSEDDHFLAKQRHIVVRDRRNRRVVAVIEIVSRSNKRSPLAVEQFVLKSVELLKAGIHLMVIDLLPPTKACPLGFHNKIWEYGHAVCDYEPAEGKNLSVVSYDASDMLEAFLEPLAVGDAMPSSPLFLLEGTHIELPLEETANLVMKFIPFDA